MSKNLDDQIVVFGDTHCDFGTINSFINKHSPAIILQCGDFGYWPRLNPVPLLTADGHVMNRHKEVKAQDTKVHFCDGNHEDHESLRLLEDHEIYPNTFYQPRGSTIVLPDGRTVLFMGGADSIDKHRRVQGRDWFPEEVISYADINKLDPDMKVDIVISHTCPLEFTIGSEIARLRQGSGKLDDPSCRMLSHVLQVYSPSLWYFGHWHVYDRGYTLGCRWTAMDMSYHAKWWEVLAD